MEKVKLFLKFYRNKVAENVVLMLVYVLVAAMISMVLFVKSNNSILVTGQLNQIGFGEEGLQDALRGTENVLSLFAVSAITIGLIGGIALISFRNHRTEKSQIILRLYGMRIKDLMLKSILDFVLFGIISAILGFCFGYVLFYHFSKSMLEVAILFQIKSVQTIRIFFEMQIFIMLIIVGGNLISDVKIMETPFAEVLYERGDKFTIRKTKCVVVGICILTYFYAELLFQVPVDIIKVCLVVVCFLYGILFLCFQLFFGVMTKKTRRKKKIETVSDLSFCFLCSRYKRDAMLAIVISIGAILLCMISNIQFNLEGILRSAYLDNMGYSILVRSDSFEEKEKIKTKLDEMGVGYTYAYSKLVPYTSLIGSFPEDEMFYALVVESQTDQNAFFEVPEQGFLAECYFASECNLVEGNSTDLFGSNIFYRGNLKGNQYLSLVSYNCIVGKEDWKFPIDESWSPIFLIAASDAEEKLIQTSLKGDDCHVESATQLINEVKELMSDYISMVVLLSVIFIIVTGAIFYTVIWTDLRSRRAELSLYRIFGASYQQAVKVINREYMIIALAASFAVSFTIMFCGELYFYFGLKKHFPLSIPITIMTTFIVVSFIMICCRIAGFAERKNKELEVIRDE